MKTVVIDIGGTAVKSALFQEGRLCAVKETPTQAWLGGAHVMSLAKEIIRSYQKLSSFDAIGISTAGQVDPVSGKIIYANENIPGYTGVKVRDILEEAFHLPVYVENDVNAAAIGEAFFGAGKGMDDFLCLTYGTGVGGAVFLNGRIYHGSSFSAGEFGAIVVHPQDRRPEQDLFSGCYERYASASALVAKARLLDPSLTSGRAIFQRIQEPQIQQLTDEWIQEIVCGLTSIIHMMNPACVILGGGVMEQPYVLPRVQSLLCPSLMPSFRHVKLVCASLGNQAGLLGAAMLPQMALH